MQQTDIFAISSDTEQMPTSVIEAMASGLPVVGTNVGDIQHMVVPANRPFVVEPIDEDKFTQRLQQLLENQELRMTVGAANRDKCVHEYSQHVMFERYAHLFDSAANIGHA